MVDLYTKYLSYVTRICFRYVKNREDAEDLAQEVFMKVMDRLNTFEGQAQLSTWLYRVAANHCLDHLRWKKRQARLIEDAVFMCDEEADFEACNREATRFMERILAGAGESERTLLTLHYAEGYTHSEIADREGVSRVAITKRLARAHERVLKVIEQLEEHGFQLPMAA